MSDETPKLMGTRGSDIKPRKPTVRDDGKGWIDILNVYSCRAEPHYSFEFSECSTPCLLLTWVAHLSEKTWFTPDRLFDLINVVSTHFGWNVHVPDRDCSHCQEGRKRKPRPPSCQPGP